ncbi:MAG: STAS domain-containing protein [Rubrobacter sp.]|nr:STAS domain-containing protein [Rubrobacter sp.]
MASHEINFYTLQDGTRKVELYGEFDLHNLPELLCALRRMTSNYRLPTLVDLSGVNFADISTLREMVNARRSCPWLSLASPSWQVRRGARACGFEEWFDYSPGPLSLAREAS